MATDPPSRGRDAPLHWHAFANGVWSPFYGFAIWLVGRVFPRRFDFEVRGREHLPATGGVLVVANHLADIDPPFLCLACAPRPAITLGASRHFAHRPLGYLLSALGTVPLRMGTADVRALRVASEHLRAGRLVVIYPEGRPSFSDRLGGFAEGAGLLGLIEGVTVVPAAIWGAHQILKGRWPLGRGPVRVVFGAPVRPPSTGRRREQARAMTAEVRSVIETMVTGLAAGDPPD